MFDKLLDARRGRDDFYRDVITLTSIFYQSPATIRDFLGKESIDKAIVNLLKAALQSDELGSAYWQQSVRPFIDFGERGFKEDWCYAIDLNDLEGPIDIPLSDERVLRLESADFRRLTTSLVYHQTVFKPADVYWVGCAFEPKTIPSWFREPNFLLRELLPLPMEVRGALSEALPEVPVSSRSNSSSAKPRPSRKECDREKRHEIAQAIFDAKVRLGGEELTADRVYADDSGIRWGFVLSPALRQSLQRSLEVRVDVRMLQPRQMNYFPVVISTPTRHPTIRFSYGMCQSIGQVASEVFFSAERPYDDGLRALSHENRRIEVQTHREDWVLGGSGCVFLWQER